jgi:hypothetical protein
MLPGTSLGTPDLVQRGELTIDTTMLYPLQQELRSRFAGAESDAMAESGTGGRSQAQAGISQCGLDERPDGGNL